jgi:PKD repeat protein
VNFDPPNPQCITGNSFDFVGTGDYQSGATFNWGFGTNATPANSTTETVDNIVFDTSGYHEVTYLVNWEQCENSITDSIFIFREPTIDFGVDTGLYCAPYIAEFTDSSNADAPITYQWDFGNGTSSTEENPIVEYDTPGIYDVTLDIEVMQGCPANLTLTKPGLIEVYPSPTADFTVSPSQTTVFDTEITISDQSIDSDELFYQLNPTTDTTERNLTFHFLEGGYHYPYQVVTNEFGCKDTATRTIYVEPQTTLYVPNAFTPDEDDINEVFKPVVLDVSNYYLIILKRISMVFTTFID